jgi:hypothetical protein
MAARVRAPPGGRPAGDVTAPARRAGLVCPQLPAAAELATIGARLSRHALVRLAIHAAAGENACIEGGFTPDDAPGNYGCWRSAARASPGGHRIPVRRDHLPALDHGAMDPAPAEERTRHDRYHP